MTLEDRIALLKALADTTRMLILSALMKEDAYVEILAERLGLAPSTISFHLKKMEECSLVHKRREQYYSVYSANTDILDAPVRDLIAMDALKETAQRERERRYKKNVLNAFMKNGRIVRIPTQHKKRAIVFEPILASFTAGELYAEPDVNSTINRFHGDHCEIRRFFIDQGLMERINGRYRLAEKTE
ncbi:metalloregulator ArsR/SmtB family transcription factor [bacterium]|nr:metalloregulator ArsR/SmtB family transcription factor [bacterium]